MEGLQTGLQASCASVPGGRIENQDRCHAQVLEARRNLWGFRAVLIVADGMGGHERGEVAAQLAVDTAIEVLAAPPEAHEQFDQDFLGAEPEEVMRRTFELANERIHNHAKEADLAGNMGTTMTAIAIIEDEAVIGHIGDTKAFLVSQDRIEQITEDHSWVAEQVRAGLMTSEQATISPLRRHLTQALGAEAEVKPYIRRAKIEPNAAFVVCSDGLTEVVDVSVIQRVFQAEDSPAEACATLCAMAVEGGTTDNVTVGAIWSESQASEANLSAVFAEEPASEALHEHVGSSNVFADNPAPYVRAEEAKGRGGEGIVPAKRSERLAVLAAISMLSLVVGLFVGKALVRSQRATEREPVTGSTMPVAASATESSRQPTRQPSGAGVPSSIISPNNVFRLEVRCEGDLLIVSSTEPVTYDVYPRGRYDDLDARLLPIQSQTRDRTRFRLPGAPPDTWHEATISLEIERLGNKRIRITPTPETLEVFVNNHPYSGTELASVEIKGRHARIGFYFPPSREGNAYAIAVADFDVEPKTVDATE